MAKLLKPTKYDVVGFMLTVTPHIALDDHEIEMEFVLASGPGGQNVNKVSTAVKLRFDVAHSASLPEDVRVRLTRLAGKRMSDDGILLLDARRYRTQERNRQDALDKLADLIRRAAEPPIPRRPTKPSKAAKQRRVDDKRKRSEAKHLRKGVRPGSDE